MPRSTNIQPSLPAPVIAHPEEAHTFPQHMELLALLVPEAAHLLPYHQTAYALAYIDRYACDVLQLEIAWDFLTQVLAECWQRHQYQSVVRLVAALALPAGRRANLAEAEQVVRLGIAASRRLRDQQQLAAFLNRLGSLMIVRGKYMPGQRVWQAGFHLAISAGSPSVLWQPLVSFAPCVDIQGYCGEVQQFVATLQRLHDPDSLAVALFSQGLCARYIADLDTAYTAFTKCIQLLLQQSPRSSCSPMRQLFSLVVQAELARVQGDCLAAQTYTATALALAGVCSDVYTMAALLIDQGVFLCQQGRLAELSQIYLQIRSLLGRTEAPHIAERCHFFAYHLLANGGIASVPDERPLPLPSAQHTYETLSAREREVLKLVADGLSNQAIATQLVITPGTVKKHLEHIYTRLDVHNRTAAVAKARAMHIVP